MRTYYCKENTIIHFLNQNEEDGKWVNEQNIGNKYEYYPLNIKENGLMIVKLYKTDYLSWGDEQFFASNRGGMNVFISLSDKKIEHVDMFGIYGDDLMLFEDEELNKCLNEYLLLLALIHFLKKLKHGKKLSC